jgi:hypothetical protein
MASMVFTSWDIYKIETRHAEALGWLCRAAGPAALTSPSLASRLVNIPNPAQFVIEALVDSGVQVPFDQLVSSAATTMRLSCRLLQVSRRPQQNPGACPMCFVVTTATVQPW